MPFYDLFCMHFCNYFYELEFNLKIYVFDTHVEIFKKTNW
jgi:hypothetical protein